MKQKSVTVRRGWPPRVKQALTFSLWLRFSGGKLGAKAEESFQVVGQSHQRPFQPDFGQAAQRKAPKTHRLLDDSKDRFHRLLALSLALSAGFGGDAVGQVF